MITNLTYQPDKGVSLNSIQIDWGFDRLTVRNLLGNTHQESNSIIDLSEFHNGSDDYNIAQRRDIYQNYDGLNNYFFLNYNKNDLLNEIEIYDGFTISIENITLSFGADFQEVVLLLKSITNYYKELSDGKYFFKNLKLTIANSDSLGSDGSNLAYFYCSQTVDHLNEE